MRLPVFFAAVLLESIRLSAATPVILISIDTLRADHLSTYGYRAIKTPNIDSYAVHGTLYANASAQVPLTLPSHTSLLSSTYPFQTLIRENAQRVDAGTVTLASVLRAQGYKTAAFIGSVFLEKDMGLDKGFDFYDSPFQYTAFSPLAGSVFYGGIGAGPNVGKDRREAPLVARAALQWLRQNKGKPTFAFLHLYDLHLPYRLASYDAELSFVDHVLGNFRQSLEAMDLWDHSIVVLVSDHGESLGDHSEQSHGYFIYQSTMHVPLIIHIPASVRTDVVKTPVGLIDVAPTILDLLGIQPPSAFAGQSLRNLGSRPVYGESYHAHDSFGWAPLRSLREGDWKYIDAPRPELYNLVADPGEMRNIFDTNRKRAEDMRSELNRLLARWPAKAAAAKPSQNQALLNSLGYLSAAPGSGSASRTSITGAITGADPKDRLPEFRMYEDAIYALAQRKTALAVSLLRKLLAKDPGNTLARRDLGACYLERKEYEPARVNLEKAAISAPDDYATQYQLGIAYKNLNQLESAATHLNIACHLSPDAIQCRQQLEEVVRKL